jgi:tetratricopeptide (TPR) repeat protein
MRAVFLLRLMASCVLFAAAGGAAQEQPAATPQSQQGSPAPSAQSPAPSPKAPPQKLVKLPTGSERRRAAKLYMAAATLYQNEMFEQAFHDYQEAARLDPANRDYAMAVEVARSHAVTGLIQEAARDRTLGNTAGARSALQRALAVDPGNANVGEHLDGLADSGLNSSILDPARGMPQLAPPIQLEPTEGVQSFHMRASQQALIQKVFKAYDIDTTVDDSIRNMTVRLDVDDVDFAQAARILGMLTGSFYSPIDPHHVVVARNTSQMRQQYMHNAVETFYLSGMDSTEMTDMGNIARNVFNVRHSAVNATAGTLTLEAPELDLNAFNATYRNLMESRPQVVLEVHLIQLAHTSTVNTGAQPPQTFTAFNVYAQEQQILSQNAALVQQIISSGLAAPGDTLTILGILLASGQVSSSLFSNGIALFGGGLTLSGISPAPVTFNLNLNSSDSRELDDYQLRLADNEEGTLKSGTRYPIQTSILSSAPTGLNIPGLNLPGTSGSLSSVLSSISNTVPIIPQIQYQDLGLVMKARPRILRSGRVAINLDLKISALAGTGLNGVPILANRSYAGVMTTLANQAVVIAGELDKSETRAISGLPGLSEIPGLNNVTEKTMDKDYSTLLIILTPHVVRSPYGLFHGPMMRVDRDIPTR